MELTDYQKAIAEHIRAAGHSVEWQPLNSGEELRIDGVRACPFRLGRDRAEAVYEPPGYLTTWRARKLSADPKKAAAALLDRHAAVLRAKAVDRALNEQRCADLEAVLGGVAEVRAIEGNEVLLLFRPLSLTAAARIAKAYRGEPQER